MHERKPAGPRRSTKWIVSAEVVLLGLYGCAPTVSRMDREELARFKQVANVRAVHYRPPSFNVRTPGKALTGGGGLGAIFSLHLFKSAGEKMTHDYSLEDPVVTVQDRFLSSVEADFGFQSIPARAPLSNDSFDELKKTFDEGMVFDFKTTDWMLFYFPTDWSHYRISYSARSRLIRLEDSEVVWQGVCKFVGKDPKTSPTWAELTAQNGATLKIKLNEAAEACAKELSAQFRGTS